MDIKKILPYMSVILVFIFLLFLCACQNKEEPSKAETELAFPGTVWNMTPEKLIRALKLKNGSYQLSEDPYNAAKDEPTGTISIAIENYNVFGTDGRVGFRFCDFTGTGRYGLNYITVEYPEDADLESMKNAMISAYGDPPFTYGSHISGWYSETMQFDVLNEAQISSLPQETVKNAKETNLCTVFLSDGTDPKNLSFYIPPVHGIVFLNSLNNVMLW